MRSLLAMSWIGSVDASSSENGVFYFDLVLLPPAEQVQVVQRL